MITNVGKNILAKYLIGQAPAYASYIAIGCGAKPLATNQSFGDYSNKESLDFEMFRVPITSRGYVDDAGVNKIVLTAELPTDERYEISEVGVFSAGSNPSAGAYDSRSLFAFTVNENWEYHTSDTAVALPIIYEPLDGTLEDGSINQTNLVFQTNSDNRLFTNTDRIERYERARFFNNIVMMRGDTSGLSVVGDHLQIGTNTNHIHLLGTALDFNKNSPTDQMKLAFSIINKDPDPSIVPDEVRILLEFAESDSPGTGEWARFEVVMSAEDYDFANNRYYVITKELQELYKSTGFTWNNVTIIKIYSNVINNGLPSEDFYIGLDAIRFENVSTTNPVYGLTGYTVLKNTNAETIIKAANTTNYIEFRFAMDVQ
ncbi:hypothetical protein EBU71_01470 [bacterium]|nr:hypothetical protein [Candidatus Elulimicrobium humile]